MNMQPPSGRRPPAVTTAEELLDILDRLQGERPDQRLVLRGQTHAHPPRPSAARPPATDEEAMARRYATVIWEAAARAVLPVNENEPHGLSDARQVAVGMAVLQHYGFRSWFIDVTEDAAVALWFARWRYTDRTELIGLGSHDDTQAAAVATQHAMSPIRLAEYVPHHDDGYVDVFATDPSSPLLLDLPHLVPETATRLHRQSGAGLLPDADGTYATSHIARVRVRVAPEDAQRPTDGRVLDQRWLFPDTDNDHVYAALLRAPRPIPAEDVKHHGSLALDLLSLPVYMSEHDQAFWSWLRTVRAVAGIYATPPLQPDTPMGLVQADVTLPFTPPGGPTAVFTRDSYLTAATQPTAPSAADPETPVAPADEDPLPALVEPALRTAWPAFPALLRVPFTRELSRVLVAGDLFPLLRGYLLDMDDHVLHARQLFEDIEGYYWLPPLRLALPWTPEQALDRLEHEDASSQGGDHVPNDNSADRWEIAAEFIVGVEVLRHTGALLDGRANLYRHCPHGYGLYWVVPDGVTPIGERCIPTDVSETGEPPKD